MAYYDATIDDFDTEEEVADQMRRGRLAHAAEEAVQKSVRRATLPVRTGTSWALRTAEVSLFTVVGFLPGLFWIHVHIFMSWVAGKNLFVPLGKEWFAPYRAVAGEFGQTGSAALGLAEKTALIVLDAVVLLALALAAGAVMLAYELATGAAGWLADYLATLGVSAEAIASIASSLLNLFGG